MTYALSLSLSVSLSATLCHSLAHCNTVELSQFCHNCVTLVFMGTIDALRCLLSPFPVKC